MARLWSKEQKGTPWTAFHSWDSWNKVCFRNRLFIFTKNCSMTYDCLKIKPLSSLICILLQPIFTEDFLWIWALWGQKPFLSSLFPQAWNPAYKGVQIFVKKKKKEWMNEWKNARQILDITNMSSIWWLPLTSSGLTRESEIHYSSNIKLNFPECVLWNSSLRRDLRKDKSRVN